jgi:glycosyltransferase involved in cell wall biosynthesis
MNYSDDDLVTCFLPVFNAEKYLPFWWKKNEIELRSVNATLVVVDNGSLDSTLFEIDRFNYPKTKLVRHGSNLGLDQSFRSAKSQIKSKYRFFLPADDWLAPGYLYDAVSTMEENPDIGVVYGKTYMTNLNTGETSKRFSPFRKQGLHTESPFLPLAFNNCIPDISLYRSSAVNTDPSSSNWFLPGGQSSVLDKYQTFFTDKDQCFSGKSDHQVSKIWAQNGRYYSFFCETYADARSLCCNNIADEIVWHLLVSNFHNRKPFISALQELQQGHPYVRTALDLSQINIYLNLALFLIDDLLLDPVERKYKTEGVFGNLQHLTSLIESLDSINLDFFKSTLDSRGMGRVFN